MRKIEFSAQREPVQFPLHPRLQCGGIHQAVVTVEVVAILRLSRPARFVIWVTQDLSSAPPDLPSLGSSSDMVSYPS